jgi:hypothetical protein
MRPSFPIARKLLLAVGGGSLLVYIANFALQARMGRLVDKVAYARVGDENRLTLSVRARPGLGPEQRR